MAKNRPLIPDGLAAEVQFAADRTCCICNVRGKFTQIHHIDSNPSNNIFENLAVLCLQCHNETHIKGGFGRKLDPTVVTKYKDEWLKAVRFRRNSANEMAISGRVEKFSMSQRIGAKSRVKFQETPSVSVINPRRSFFQR